MNSISTNFFSQIKNRKQQMYINNNKNKKIYKCKMNKTRKAVTLLYKIKLNRIKITKYKKKVNKNRSSHFNKTRRIKKEILLLYSIIYSVTSPK